MQKLIVVAGLTVLFLSVFAFNNPQEPDPKMVSLAVRATIFAQPSPTIHYVEVTRLVEVTTVVEVTRLVEITRIAEATATPIPAPTEPATPTSDLAAAQPASLAAAQSANLAAAPLVAQSIALEPACPAHSTNSYSMIPVEGPRAAHADVAHGDLNLALRGYVPVDSVLALVDINGPADSDAPQLAGIFPDLRVPVFTRTARVRGWDWNCGAQGCRGEPLSRFEVTLASMQTAPAEPISIPSRDAEIYGGGFKALVLYADANRITLTYTREDSVANGYSVHIEDLCVDPNLLTLYRQNNASGRANLPALPNGATLGTSQFGEISVAVRDRGQFGDPRSRKDWWQGR